VSSHDQPSAAPGAGAKRRDHELAYEVAVAAGRLLCEIREGLAIGADPDELRNEGDRRSHELLVELLRRYAPGDAVLSEEGEAIERTDAPRTWIIDPLDGTREFGEPERVDWAVHVALLEHGNLAAGAVALPALALTYGTGLPPPRVAVEQRPVRIAVSRTRPAAEAEALAAQLAGELVPMGSAGAKAMAVVSGDVDVYLHSGGQFVWDSAAPVAVAAAAGLHASRVDGSPLVYDAATTWLPDVVICRAEVARPVIEAVRDFHRAEREEPELRSPSAANLSLSLPPG
jgi:3'(2'), 5'-bisphosphate nucleotidase